VGTGRRARIVVLALLWPACAAQRLSWVSPHGRDHPLAGRIWSPAERRFVDFAALAEVAARTPLVLLGEKHDNADHHLLQARVIAELVRRGRRPAVVMEMLGPEKEKPLADYRKAHPHDALGLGPALAWEKSGWPDYALYAPVLRAAFDAGLLVLPGDASKRRILAVSAHGLDVLPPEERHRLALDLLLPEATRTELLAELAESHCGLMPPAAVQRMLSVERLRDATLADALLRAAHGSDGAGSAVLIAGHGHVRRDWAVPWYLAARYPEKRSLAIAFFEVRPGVLAPEAYLPKSAGPPPYDFIWFTPFRDVTDPCIQLREHLKRKAHPTREAP
jgi:uncharacterized iron-regulated protein